MMSNPPAGQHPGDDDRELVRFLVVALGLGLGLQLPALINPAFFGLALVVMWVPTLAVALAGKGARREARARLARPWPWRMMLVASVLGWSHKIVSGLLGVAVGACTIDVRHFEVGPAWRVTRADFLWWFPASGEPLPLFVAHLFVMQLVGVAIVSPLMACGEEIGWRGFLQWRLVRRWGLRRGTLLVGVLWAYWHVGFMLAGHNGGGEHRLLNALVLFPWQLVVVSFLYAWLVHRTGSALPAICAHAANNSFPDDKMFTTVSWVGEKSASFVTTCLLAVVVYLLFRLAPVATSLEGPGRDVPN